MDRLFVVKYNDGQIRLLRTDGEEPDNLIKQMFKDVKIFNIDVTEIKKIQDIPLGHLIEMPYNEKERSAAEIIAGFSEIKNIFMP